jgi:3-oxoadipate enol-lactonase
MPMLATNQTNLYYEVSGEGQPVVLIHGLGSSTRDWESQVSELSKSHQVITLDLRGHGRSDKPAGPYQIPMFAADLAGLLQALGIFSAHLAGLSLGGGVAFQFALDYPSRVRSLTLVNTAPALGGAPEQAEQEIARRVGIVQQLGMRAMGQALSPNLFPKPEQAALRETFVERWAANDPQAYIEATRSMLGWDVTARLGAITCPVLVIASDQDYRPVSAKEAYLKLMPNARLAVIPDAHHAVPMERPEAFNPLLAQFISEQDGQLLAANKAAIRNYLEQVWTKQNTAAIDQYIAPDCIQHIKGVQPGSAGVHAVFAMIRAAFSDISFTVEEMLAEGDKVCWRFVISAQHTGPFQGLPATGKSFKLSGMSIARLAGGRLVEAWGEQDNLGLTQQLRAVARVT